MKKIFLMCLFVFILPFKQITEFHPNGTPKILKVYSDQNQIKLIKEIGYYSDGAKHYQATYNNDEISNIQRWDKKGRKINLKSSENKFLESLKSPIEFDQNKEKQNQLDSIIRRQDNKILYMKYKTDSLKVEISNHQIAFDEYKRDTQSDIARLESDFKSETSRRKSDDRKINKTITKENKQLILKINNALDSMKESVSDLEKKIDRIKEKSFMTDDEYKRFKENQQDFDNVNSIEKKENTKNQKPPSYQFISYDTAPEAKPGMGIRAKYPEEAKAAGIEGTVIVQFFVDTKGNVLEAYVTKGIPNTGLDEAALSAIKKSKWKPALKRGEKVGVWMTLPIKFVLR